MAEDQSTRSAQTSKRFLQPSATTFASKSLRTLAYRIAQLSETHLKRGGRGSCGELEKTLHHLKSSRLRSTESARVFRESGGLDALLQVSSKLQPAREVDCKTLALLWGTVANLCALDEASRVKV